MKKCGVDLLCNIVILIFDFVFKFILIKVFWGRNLKLFMCMFICCLMRKGLGRIYCFVIIKKRC